MKSRKLHLYVARNGRCPFETWLHGLRDIRARARIRARLDRLSLGNAGDMVGLGDGVFELRMHIGPGYRLYVAFTGQKSVLLLLGGTKRSQARDIARAKSYLQDYRNRQNGHRR